MNYNYRRWIGFGMVVTMVMVCFIITSNGDSNTQSESQSVNIYMQLEPLVTFTYNGGDVTLSQVTADPFRYNSTFNSYPNIFVRTKLSHWQLDVGMDNGGKLLHDGDTTKTANPLTIYLKDTVDGSDSKWTSSWPVGSTGLVSDNMVTMDPNDAGRSYTFYPKYGIVTTLADPGGQYTGSVTWTLTIPMV